jgi:hypothetical protein
MPAHARGHPLQPPPGLFRSTLVAYRRGHPILSYSVQTPVLRCGTLWRYNSLEPLVLWGREGVEVSAYILRKLPGGGNGAPNASRSRTLKV